MGNRIMGEMRKWEGESGEVGIWKVESGKWNVERGT